MMAASHKEGGREEKKEPLNVTDEGSKPSSNSEKGGTQATSILYTV